jgi:hypothetical protein
MSIDFSDRSRLIRSLPVLVACGVVLSGVGVAAAISGGTSAAPQEALTVTGDAQSYVDSTRTSASALTSSDAIPEVLSGLGSLVRSVRAVPALDGRLNVTIELPSAAADQRDLWVSDLAFGAVAELVHPVSTASLNELAASAAAVGPDKAGTSISTALGIGGVRFGQLFKSPDDATLLASATKVAEQYGLKLESANVLHPLESALDATFSVPDGASVDWSIDQLRDALVGSTPNVEGVLITLVAPDGAKLLQAGTSYRTGNGGLWFAPGQDSRFGAQHGHMPVEAP